jgi:hypothetical protein
VGCEVARCKWRRISRSRTTNPLPSTTRSLNESGGSGSLGPPDLHFSQRFDMTHAVSPMIPREVSQVSDPNRVQIPPSICSVVSKVRGKVGDALAPGPKVLITDVPVTTVVSAHQPHEDGTLQLRCLGPRQESSARGFGSVRCTTTDQSGACGSTGVPGISGTGIPAAAARKSAAVRIVRSAARSSAVSCRRIANRSTAVRSSANSTTSRAFPHPRSQSQLAATMR